MAKRPSKQYWKDRFEQLENASHLKASEYAGRLDTAYRKASKKVQNEINLWYARFALNNEISMADARKLLTQGELEEFKWSVQEYIEKGRISKGFEKQLENASAKVHISRLEALQLQMQEHVETLYQGEDNGLTNTLKRIYTDNYYHTAFEIQKGFGIGYDLMKLDIDRVEKAIFRPWASDGANFSDRIWKSKAQLMNTLNTELTQAIILGKNPSTLIDTVSKKFDVSRAQAGRLLYTEASFVASASERDSFKDLGVEEYEILATLDNKTSEICQGMDGQHFPMSQYEIGTTAPPFHPNCRTTTVPYFDDEFTLDETRAYRDANGKGTVPASMKYPEWEEKYVKRQSVDSNIKANEPQEVKNLYDTIKPKAQDGEIPTHEFTHEIPKKNINELSLDEATEELRNLETKKSELEKDYFEILTNDNTEDKWERLKDIQNELDHINESGQEKALQDRINTVKSEQKKTLNQINAKGIEKANSKGKAILSEAYESHRIINNLEETPISEIPDYISVNYKGLTPEVANIFNDTIEELVKEYDTTIQEIRVMTPMEYTYNVNVFANVSHDYSVDKSIMLINPAKCSNIEKLRERIYYNIDKGNISKIPKRYADKYVATHEFMHTLFNMGDSLRDKTNFVNADYNKIKKLRAEVSDLYDKYVKAVKNDSSIQISEYSLEDADEFMAESFALIKLGGKGNKYAVEAVKIVDKYFKR